MRTTCFLALFLNVMMPALTRGDDPPLKMSAEEQEVVNLINAQRKLARVDELQPDTRLFHSARLHAANMAKQNKLDHELDGKTMADRLQATGYNLESVAENIAWKQTTPRKLVASWMESEGHKKNILTGDFIHIGIGVAMNTKGERFWVAVFATPLVK